jgi:Rap1a immunity proteins
MKAIATTAIAALLLAGTALAQQPGQRPAQRPPAQAQRQPAPAAGPTMPTRVTARLLSDLCGQDRGACLGYVTASTDTWAAALAAAGRPQVACIPANVNNDQLTQTVVRYLRAHPEEGGLNAAVVIFAALKSAFPCGY